MNTSTPHMSVATVTEVKTSVATMGLTAIAVGTLGVFLGMFSAAIGVGLNQVATGDFQAAAISNSTTINLLPNPSFEQNTIATDYQTYQATVKQSTGGFFGTYAAQVDTKSGGLYKKFTIGSGLKPGATYLLSALLKREAGENYKQLTICVQYYKDALGTWRIECGQTAPSTLAGQWYPTTLQFTTTANSTARQDVFVYVGYANGGTITVGRFFIDGASLYQVTPQALLPNPSFEQSTILDEYQAYQATVKQSSKAHTGTHSVEVDTKAGGLYRRFTIGSTAANLKPGTTYWLSSYLQHETGENYNQVSVCAQYYKDSVGSWQIECADKVPTDGQNQWNISQLTFTTTANPSARQDVILYVGYADGGTTIQGRYFIDDAVLVPAPSPTLNVEKNVILPDQNISNNTNQGVLGSFKLTGSPEPVVITQLPFFLKVMPVSVTPGTFDHIGASDIDNVAIYDEQGKVVEGPFSAAVTTNPDGSLEFAFPGINHMTIPVGSHYYTVRGDISAGISNGAIIQATLKPTLILGRGQTTNKIVAMSPSIEVLSAMMTVKAAALNVSFNPVVPAQSVVAGTKGHIFAYVKLDATNSAEDIVVARVNATIDSLSPANPSQTTNWSIFDGSIELATLTDNPGDDPDALTSANTTAGANTSTTFGFSTPLVIAKRTAKTLTIKADIASNATVGGVSVGCQDVVGAHCVNAKGASSGTPASTTITSFAGNLQAFVRSGTLTITADPSTPPAGLMPANTRGVTLAAFKASAELEEIRISRLYLTGEQVNNGGWDQVKKLYLYQGSTLIQSVAPTSTDGVDRTVLFDLANNPIVVSKDGSTVLTFKADTVDSNYEIGSVGASGQGIRLKINSSSDVTARGASGSALIPIVVSAAGNPQYLFHSVPIVTPDNQLPTGVHSGTLPSNGTTYINLYKFKITASSAGDVGLYHLVFKITTSNVTVKNLSLVTGNDLFAVAHEWQPNFSSDEHHMQFNNELGRAIIPAGTSREFSLKANITCSFPLCAGPTGSGSVQVYLLGDTGPIQPLPGTAVQIRSTGGGHFIWTDFWRTPVLEYASSTASTTEQWSNGYLVPTFDGGVLPAVSVPAILAR